MVSTPPSPPSGPTHASGNPEFERGSAAGGTRADETAIRAWGQRLAAQMQVAGRAPTARAQQRLMRVFIDDPELRGALFRLVDVRPACANRSELVVHLNEYLSSAAGSKSARSLSRLVSPRGMRAPVALATSLGVGMMARQFIAGNDIELAQQELRGLWDADRCTTVDLLGEATFTEREGRSYGDRCAQALRVMSAASARWPEHELLDRDGLGPLPRANLSVKISALTPHLRANAPARALDGVGEQLRELLRLARDLGAHLHVDMESLDTRESITELLLAVLSESEFAAGPSAGIVLQAYMTDSETQLDRLLDWVATTPRAVPFTIRLVKGAYWDHEVVQALQAGWPVPVFTDRRECDRHYEHLTRRLLDQRAGDERLRVAIASHNLRSISHALAYSDHLGLVPEALELQALRGLGDDIATAIAACDRRVRTYCPVGDLVAGMAYLVRRLLENTANDSFLAAAATGADFDALMERP